MISRSTPRILLLGFSAAFATLLLTAFIGWLLRYPSLGEAFSHFWQFATGDTLVLLCILDVSVFTVAAFFWMISDSRQRGERIRWWVPLVLLIGSPVWLLYLALREARE